MNARDGMRRLRAERKEWGRCVTCGMCAPAPGRVRCEYCLDALKKYNKRRRAREKEARAHD